MNTFIITCNNNWIVEKVHIACPDTDISTGSCFTDFFTDSCKLEELNTPYSPEQAVLSLHLAESDEKYTAIICNFTTSFLIFLFQIENQKDLTEILKLYIQYYNKTSAHYGLPYDDGYYEIQQMNNQLINSQRALAKTNHRLNKVLQEIRDANNTIAILEHDELTNLFCVSAFYKKAQDELLKFPDTDFDIITLDMERFKLVNETFGRDTGDQLLKDIALQLVGLEHADDGLFSRVSGDIFYIFIPSRFQFYTTLKEQMENFLDSYPLPMQLHLKIGVYSYKACPSAPSPDVLESVPDAPVSIEQMCDRALFALDSLSDTRGTKLAFYDEKLQKKLSLENQILDHLEEALANHEFKLYLQPKVHIPDGSIIGGEALVRWIHPELGFVTPDNFIPLLERTGLIYEVDKFIWEEACKVLNLLAAHGFSDFSISVNVARNDLYQNDLIDVLLALIRKYNLKPCQLKLEIIERAYATDSPNIHKILSALQENGFLIEMDDFGTGESSLSMIAEMPIDFIKLDRSFLTSDLTNPKHLEIIRLIISLAKTLHMDIIAEGVETQEQSDLLYSLGCRYVQGYFYGKPVPAMDFIKQVISDEPDK